MNNLRVIDPNLIIANLRILRDTTLPRDSQRIIQRIINCIALQLDFGNLSTLNLILITLNLWTTRPNVIIHVLTLLDLLGDDDWDAINVPLNELLVNWLN